MKILLIAGHGAGDPGATGNGYKEADLTREQLALVYDRLKSYATVTKYDIKKNCFRETQKGNPPSWKSYDYVVELHFNSSTLNTGYGSEIYVSKGRKKIAKAEKYILENFEKMGFRNRGIKTKSLTNLNECTKARTPYCLIETCFIVRSDDMAKYIPNKAKAAQAIVDGIVKGFKLTSNTVSPPVSKVLYKVQCGAFSKRENAVALQNKLNAINQQNFIVKDDGLYKVQCGAFAVKENANKLANQLKKKGFDTYVRSN